MNDFIIILLKLSFLILALCWLYFCGSLSYSVLQPVDHAVFLSFSILTLKLLNVGLKVMAGKENAMNINKILNPIDGSEHSINSTRYTIELAKLMDAQIILLHCHDRFPIVLAEPYFQQAVNEINQSSETLIEPFIKMLEQGEVRFETRILEGTPGNRIPEIAKIEKIDLIVMGSRGVTDFAGLFLGSVAHQVLHKSEIPIFITK